MLLPAAHSDVPLDELMRGSALQLANIARQKPPADVLRSVVAIDGVQVQILILPQPVTIAVDAHLTPCGRDILLTLLRRHPERATGDDIQQSLEESERLWGASTIKRALADLIRQGLLDNQRDGRGYGLTAAGFDLAQRAAAA